MSLLCSALTEELSEQCGGGFGTYPGRDLHPVIVLIGDQHVETAARRSGLRVGGGVDYPPQSGVDDRPRAHAAGFQGNVERGVGQTVIAHPLGGGPDGQHFGMSAGVVARHWPIPAFPDNISIPHQQRPHRHLALGGGPLGEIQGTGHELVVKITQTDSNLLFLERLLLGYNLRRCNGRSTY